VITFFFLFFFAAGLIETGSVSDAETSSTRIASCVHVSELAFLQ
jgi:hypothetical protein